MTSSEEDFAVEVRTTAPPASALLAPERDVTRGRYVTDSLRARRDKDRADQQLPRGRRRWLPRHRLLVGTVGAASLSVAAVGVVVMARSGGHQQDVTAPTTVAATVSTTTPPATTAAASVVPTTTATTPPSFGPTTVVVAPSVGTPAVAELQRWGGTYHLVSTVVDGNANFPPGTVTEADVTFTATCAAGSCTIQSAEFQSTPWQASGDSLTLQTTFTEPCPKNPGTSITDTLSIRLTVVGRDADGAPSSITGQQDVASPEAALCADGSVNDPVTYALTMTRTG